MHVSCSVMLVADICMTHIHLPLYKLLNYTVWYQNTASDTHRSKYLNKLVYIGKIKHINYARCFCSVIINFNISKEC